MLRTIWWWIEDLPTQLLFSFISFNNHENSRLQTWLQCIKTESLTRREKVSHQRPRVLISKFGCLVLTNIAIKVVKTERNKIFNTNLAGLKLYPLYISKVYIKWTYLFHPIHTNLSPGFEATLFNMFSNIDKPHMKTTKTLSSNSHSLHTTIFPSSGKLYKVNITRTPIA